MTLIPICGDGPRRQRLNTQMLFNSLRELKSNSIHLFDVQVTQDVLDALSLSYFDFIFLEQHGVLRDEEWPDYIKIAAKISNCNISDHVVIVVPYTHDDSIQQNRHILNKFSTTLNTTLSDISKFYLEVVINNKDIDDQLLHYGELISHFLDVSFVGLPYSCNRELLIQTIHDLYNPQDKSSTYPKMHLFGLKSEFDIDDGEFENFLPEMRDQIAFISSGKFYPVSSNKRSNDYYQCLRKWYAWANTHTL